MRFVPVLLPMQPELPPIPQLLLVTLQPDGDAASVTVSCPGWLCFHSRWPYQRRDQMINPRALLNALLAASSQKKDGSIRFDFNPI
jgi:hypothetical protein